MMYSKYVRFRHQDLQPIRIERAILKVEAGIDVIAVVRALMVVKSKHLTLFIINFISSLIINWHNTRTWQVYFEID